MTRILTLAVLLMLGGTAHAAQKDPHPWFAKCRAPVAALTAQGKDFDLRMQALGDMAGMMPDSAYLSMAMEAKTLILRLKAAVAVCANTPARMAEFEAATHFNANLAAMQKRIDMAVGVMSLKQLLIGRN